MKEIRITQDEEAELVGQIVDVFEDFLESKGVNVENEERDEYWLTADINGADCDGEESPAIIFGADHKNVRKAHSFRCGMDSTPFFLWDGLPSISVFV